MERWQRDISLAYPS